MFRLVGIIFLIHTTHVVYSQNVDCNQPMPDITGVECCQGASLINETDIMECFDKFGQPNLPMADGQHACLGECVFNKTKLLKDGQLDKEMAISLISKLPTEYQSMWTNVLETCEIKANKKKAELSKSVEFNTNSCQMTAKFLMECSCKGLIKNCPANKFLSNNADCNAKKQYLEKCAVKSDE